jgi:hypothetical protein
VRQGASEAHAVFVVLDDVEHRQLPERRHVEGLVHLALIDGAIAEEGRTQVRFGEIAVCKRDAGAQRHVGADDAVAAEEVLLAAEHVHGAALALGIAAAAPGELCHHALRIHAAGEHMAVVAIAGDDRVLGHRECPTTTASCPM